MSAQVNLCRSVSAPFSLCASMDTFPFASVDNADMQKVVLNSNVDSRLPRGTWKEEPPDSLRDVDLPIEIAANTLETVEIGRTELGSTAADLAVHISIRQRDFLALCDTGATTTCLSATLLPWLKERGFECQHSNCRIIGVGEGCLRIVGTGTLAVQIGSTKFLASVVIVDGLPYDVILGKDFMKRHHFIVDTL